MAEVVIDIIGKDNFSGVLGNFGSIITGIESAINLVGKAFDAAAGAIQPFIDSASESEVALTALNTVLASSGGSASFTSQQLQDMALAMMNLSGFSDEAQMSAQAMLLRYENLNDILPQALQLTNDLAVSLGIDLTQAAKYVGIALDDPEQGIGRLNTQFRIFNDTEMDTIKNMAAHGDVAGAQALIMEALTLKVGGAAEAYSKTFAGSLDIAREKLDNMRETIGGPILVVLGDLLAKLTEFAETNPIIQGVLGFFERFNDLLRSEGDIPFFAALGAAMLTLENISPLLHDIGYALIVMQGALNTGATPLEAFKKALDDLQISAKGTWLGDLATSIEEFITTGETEGWGTAISEVLTTAIGIGFSTIKDVILPYLSVLADKAIPIINESFANADWTLLSETIAGVLSTALEIMFTRMEIITKLIEGIDWATIAKALFNALVNAFMIVIDEGANSLIELLTRLFGDPDVATFQAGVKAGAEKLGKAFLGLIFPPSLFYNFDLAEVGRNIWEGILNGLNDWRMDWNKWWEDHLVTPIKKFLGIASPSTVFSNIGKDLIRGLIGGVDSMWNAIVSKFEDLFKAILNLPGIKQISNFLGVGTGGGLGGASGTSDLGGGTGGTGGGTVVNQYFAGATINVGSWDAIAYDCMYPNPFVSATGGQLSGATGIAGGGR